MSCVKRDFDAWEELCEKHPFSTLAERERWSRPDGKGGYIVSSPYLPAVTWLSPVFDALPDEWDDLTAGVAGVAPRVREAVLKRDGNRCQSCGVRGTVEAPLEMHHRHYLCVGEEMPSDLISLCGPCHRGERGVHYPQGRYVRNMFDWEHERRSEDGWEEFVHNQTELTRDLDEEYQWLMNPPKW